MNRKGSTRITPQLYIDSINSYAAKGEWFWVASLAKDANGILVQHLDKLDPVARIAVEHYAYEETEQAGPEEEDEYDFNDE